MSEIAFISLTKGATAIVDADVYDRLSKFNWHLSSKGYAARSEGGRKNKRIVYMHRLIAGAGAGQEVDHKDRNKLNNCVSNLRLATRQQNACNLPLRKGNKTGYRGVCSNGNKKRPWRAVIAYKGKQHNLGSFESIEAASSAYKMAAKRLHGEFASV